MGAGGEAKPGGLPDPAASRAVLIGASGFEHLDDLPAVANNLTRLAELLTDPDVWGLPAENCVVIGQEDLSGARADTVALDAIQSAAEAATDTLLVYYAGHGLLNSDDDLYLALPGSNPDRLYTAVDYKWVRDALRAAKKAVRKAVILDCCYAGRAAAYGMARTQSAASRAAFEGSHLLAAAAPTAKAWAEPGEQYTAFTGELIATLENGVPGGPPMLDMETVYQRMRAALAAKARPLPEQYSRAAGQSIVIARNPAHVAKPVELPAAIGDLLRAQIRAAEVFPYRLAGSRVSGLAATYVRQVVTSAYAAEHEEGGPQHLPGPSSREKTATTDRSPVPVNEILSRHDHVIITGGPGMGKSTTTLQLARDLAQSLLSSDATVVSPAERRLIPLRITATALAEGTGPFNGIVAKAASAQLGRALDRRLPDRLLETAPPGTRWLLIVDGIDEIVDRVQRRELLSELAVRMAAGTSDIRILLTSRPLPKGELELLPQASVERYELEPFDAEQLEAFAHRWFAGDAPEAGAVPRFLEQVQTGRLKDLVRIPLLAVIAAIVYKPDRTLPTNRYELYEQYLAHLTSARAQDAAKQWRQLTARLGPLSQADTARVSDLFENRMALTRHAAEIVVSGKGDLLDGAIAWAESNGGRLSGPPSVWRELVANALDATSLFVREADQLRFIHLSFAEHLAAAAAARRLPARFSPDDQSWSSIIRAALNENNDKREPAITALIHYAHVHAGRDELFSWLEAGSRECGLLAGRLLAAGVPCDDTRIGAFRRLLDYIARGLTTRPEWEWELSEIWDIAAQIPDHSIAESLACISADDSLTIRARHRALSALKIHSTTRMIEAARTLVSSPGADAASLLHAAELIGSCGEDHAVEAAGILRDVFMSAGIGTDNQRRAADIVAGLGPEYIEHAAGMYRNLLAFSGASLWDREWAAVELGRLGTPFCAEGAAALLDVLKPPFIDLAALRWAAQDLAELDAKYKTVATEVLKEALANSDIEVSERLSVAQMLVVLDPEGVDDTILILCELAAQSTTSVKERTDIAELIAELDPAASDKAASILGPIAESTLADSSKKIRALHMLGGLGAAFIESTALLLRKIAELPGTNAADRVKAAEEFFHLGPEYVEDAISLVLPVVKSNDVDLSDRLDAVEILVSLAPDRIPEIAQTLRSVLRSPGISFSAAGEAARAIGDLGPAYVGEAMTTFCRVLDSGSAGVSERIQIAKDISEWEHYADKAESSLNAILDIPGLRVSDRVKAAEVLGMLGTSQAAHAADRLRWVIRTPGIDMSDRVDAAEVLGQLGPAYVSEAADALRSIVVDGASSQEDRRSALKAFTELGLAQLNEIAVALQRP